MTTAGLEGQQRLTDAGCLDLGQTQAIAANILWQVTFDVRELPPDLVARFSPGASYTLFYVIGDDAGGRYVETGIPPVSLAP